tara:strand:+ start:58102 stop:58305 length:204 start_codon:yes stop_codon:yes gene_type:complete
MGNMSYCRFENTARDLRDCVRAIENDEVYDFNDYELNGFKELIRLAEKLAQMDHETEEIIVYYENKD